MDLLAEVGRGLSRVFENFSPVFVVFDRHRFFRPLFLFLSCYESEAQRIVILFCFFSELGADAHVLSSSPRAPELDAGLQCLRPRGKEAEEH